MTDQPIDLPVPTIDAEVSIPPALAAVRPRKVKAARPAAPVVPAPVVVAPVVVAPVVVAPVVVVADIPSVVVNPTVAAPTDTIIEEPTMDSTIENVVETTTDKIKDGAQAFAADMNTRAHDAMDKTTKLVADLNGYTKANVEALVESGKLAVAGIQTLAEHQAAYVRKQFEDATTAARTMAGVKSPTEFVKLQGEFVRQQVDGAVAEMSRSTEAMLKLAGEVFQPISNRVAVTVERIKMAA